MVNYGRGNGGLGPEVLFDEAAAETTSANGVWHAITLNRDLVAGDDVRDLEIGLEWTVGLTGHRTQTFVRVAMSRVRLLMPHDQNTNQPTDSIPFVIPRGDVATLTNPATCTLWIGRPESDPQRDDQIMIASDRMADFIALRRFVRMVG